MLALPNSHIVAYACSTCFAGPMPLSGHLLVGFSLLLLYSAAAAAAAGGDGAPRFREAPQFYNSPGCAPPLPPSSAASCSPSAMVHVAMTLDIAYLRGSMAVIVSVLQHTSCPQSIQFHFVASSAIDYLNTTVSNSFPSLSFRIYPFDNSLVSSLISTSIHQALDCA